MTATFKLPDAPEAGSADGPAKKRGGGPRTEEGKMASRCNSMTHGMRAKVLLPDDLVDAVARRTAELTEQFDPVTTYEAWLVSEMAKAGAKVERCDEMMIHRAGASPEAVSHPPRRPPVPSRSEPVPAQSTRSRPPHRAPAPPVPA